MGASKDVAFYPGVDDSGWDLRAFVQYTSLSYYG